MTFDIVANANALLRNMAAAQTGAPNMGHTPGPWEAMPEVLLKGCHVGGRSPAVRSTDRKIADVYRVSNKDHGRNEQCEANARLIAAAPDLLDACNGLLGLLQLISGRPDLPVGLDDLLLLNHRTVAARAAIAKAGK